MRNWSYIGNEKLDPLISSDDNSNGLRPSEVNWESDMAIAEMIQAFEMLEYEKGHQKSTVRNYVQKVRKVLEALGKDPCEITTQELREYIFTLRKESNLSPNTVRATIVAMRVFFKAMMSEGICESNPAGGVICPEQRKKKPVYLTPEQARRLLDLPSAYSVNGVRDRALLALMLMCGLRNSEVRQLRLVDVSVLDAEVVVNEAKCDGDRVIPMNDICCQAVKTWLRLRERQIQICAQQTGEPVENPYLFIGRWPGDGKCLCSSAIVKIVKRYVASMNIPQGDRISPHKLRHSFATLLHGAGCDVLEIKELLGHKNIKSTMIYTHPQQETLRRSVGKLNRVLGDRGSKSEIA